MIRRKNRARAVATDPRGVDCDTINRKGLVLWYIKFAAECVMLVAANVDKNHVGSGRNGNKHRTEFKTERPII